MALNESLARTRGQALHDGGLHCAEAVLQAVLEQTEAGGNPLVPRMAACYMAGVGRTKEELCGALAGGLMAAGCIMGRQRPGESTDAAALVAQELREQFQAFYGSTRCATILEAMGPQENSHLCHRLSSLTAALTCRVLDEAGC